MRGLLFLRYGIEHYFKLHSFRFGLY
jgi:hypothetical protein